MMALNTPRKPMKEVAAALIGLHTAQKQVGSSDVDVSGAKALTMLPHPHGLEKIAGLLRTDQ